MLKQQEETFLHFIEEHFAAILKKLNASEPVDEKTKDLMYSIYIQGIADTCYIIAMAKLKKDT